MCTSLLKLKHLVFIWKKMEIKVSETLSNSNGHIQTAYDENGGEDKPMLQVKMNGNDDQGINALISRQLQGKHVLTAALVHRHEHMNVRLFSLSPFKLVALVSLRYSIYHIFETKTVSIC